jgi:hypothetical protein
MSWLEDMMSSYNKTPGDDHPVLVFLIFSILV